MNFFPSEEHIRNYTRFDPATEDGIVPLPDVLKLFSIDYFRRRLDPDYFSKRLTYRGKMFKVLKEIGKTGPLSGKNPNHSFFPGWCPKTLVKACRDLRFIHMAKQVAKGMAPT